MSDTISQPDGTEGASPISGRLRRLLARETPRQAGMLFSAQTGALAAGLLVSVVQARWMEPREMGRLAFCLSVLFIAGLFPELGIFATGARLLALSRDQESARRQLGALVTMAAVIGAVYSLVIALIAIPIDSFFETDVRWLLIAASIPAFFQPFQTLTEQACQGLNQIRRLSVFQLVVSWSYLLMVAGLAFLGRLTAEAALLAYLTGTAIAAIWTLGRLRPRFSEIGPNIRLTLRGVREYGLNIYLARITGSALARLDSLVIGYFLGRSAAGLAPLGLYAIAQKMGNALINLPRAVAITRFRSFANLTRVPERITRWNAALLIAASTTLALIGPAALKFAFPKYGDAAPLLLPFAVLGLFAGLFQPYNAFLASHGRGAELRNIAAIVALGSLVGLILTVPRFGIMGAACTGAGAMALDYLLHLFYYRQFRKVIIEVSPPVEK
ncbi:MAG TPA: oligosaccharide flippase family protein [Blastocatellia bacterium]|nr:oligosaccharide flippase family protein [Blastocatellia bacterium]